MLMRRLGLRLSVKMALNKTMNYLQNVKFQRRWFSYQPQN